MDPGKFIQLQQQMKLNQSEMKDSFEDLDSWLGDIKTKEDKLKNQDEQSSKKLPPVRNSLQKKRRKKIKKKTEDAKDGEKAKRISGYDFQSWDKFDVDRACEQVDNNVSGSSDSEYETDDEWEEIRMKQQATMLKDEGNQLFKEGKLNEAIECYTRGIQCDRYNALLPANRAMALMKQDKFGAAELDCTAAIALDPTYVKAYQRRGTSRIALKKYAEAKSDFQRVRSLDAKNKLAKSELEKLDKLMNPPKFSVSTEGDIGIVRPIYKKPEERSKKPLHRLVIEEVGDDTELVATPSQKSETQQKLVNKDNEEFDKLMKNKKNEEARKVIECSSENSQSSLLEEITSPADIAKILIPQQNTREDKDHERDTPNLKLDLDKPSDGDSPTMGWDRSAAAASVRPKTTKAVASPETSPRVPPPPPSSYQFQTDCKVLKNTTQQFYEYFKQINPKSYPKLFGQFLDADMLMKVLHTLKDFYVPHNLDIVLVLQQLALVKRFDMTVMFLSSKDKQVILDLTKSVEGKCDPATLTELKRLYQV